MTRQFELDCAQLSQADLVRVVVPCPNALVAPQAIDAWTEISVANGNTISQIRSVGV